MKKGFTLIELLAVIVILAIIALIATPIVLNIINDTKESAVLRSADFYLDALELSIAQSVLENKNITDGTYPIMRDGNICLGAIENSACTGDILETEVNGETPISGEITITNSQISDLSLVYNAGIIIRNENGELVYHNITEPIELCTANTIKATALIWDQSNSAMLESSYANGEVGLLASSDGAYTPGVAYTCNFIDNSVENNMIFFVLSSTEDTVTLISGANLEGTVAWSADGSNHKDESEDAQAVTAKAALTERTSNWLSENGGKLNEAQSATIKLPTAHQIAEATGQIFSGYAISGLPTWLTSYTKMPVAYGYWTSTPYASSSTVWYVNCNGKLNLDSVDDGGSEGIRPVITLTKGKLNTTN